MNLPFDLAMVLPMAAVIGALSGRFVYTIHARLRLARFQRIERRLRAAEGRA
jgi:hypothetical protein